MGNVKSENVSRHSQSDSRVEKARCATLSLYTERLSNILRRTVSLSISENKPWA